MASDRRATLQWVVPHQEVYGQHALDAVDLKTDRREGKGRGGEGREGREGKGREGKKTMRQSYVSSWVDL